MGKCKTIAVIYGSDSSEWKISCRSGEYVASCLDGALYAVYEVFARFGTWELVAMRGQNAMRTTFPEGARPQVDKSDFSVTVHGEKVRFDFAYIINCVDRDTWKKADYGASSFSKRDAWRANLTFAYTF